MIEAAVLAQGYKAREREKEKTTSPQYTLLLRVKPWEFVWFNLFIHFVWFFLFFYSIYLRSFVRSSEFFAIFCPPVLTCVSEVTSSWRIFVRPDDSSFNKSASELPVRLVKPAKIVNPISSNFRAKHQAKGDSQPVIKIAFPLAATWQNIKVKTSKSWTLLFKLTWHNITQLRYSNENPRLCGGSMFNNFDSKSTWISLKKLITRLLPPSLEWQ